MIDAVLGYSPSDFLLFSESVYWRLFARANAATWPAAAITPIAAMALLAATGRSGMRRAVGLSFATAWAGVSLFFIPLYREINWAIAHLAPGFWLEAVLLLIWALASRTPERPGPVRQGIGWTIGLTATLGWPLLSFAPDRSIAAAQVVGLAPDPTALATLAAALLFARGVWTPLLAAAPFAWCMISAATLLTMGAWEGWLLIIGAVLALVGLASGRQKLRTPPT